MPRQKSISGNTIYARIDPKDKKWLGERVNAEGDWSESMVISQLLKYLRSLSVQDQRNLIKYGPDFAGVGEIINYSLWLGHAFSQEFWQWALEECYRLAAACVQAQSGNELWSFAQYRAAFCWLEIAILLRREAIKLHDPESWNNSSWDKSYACADWALCASIVHNKCHSVGRPGAKEIFKAESRHPLVAYNLACGMSLRAQYAIERQLGVRAPFFFKPMANQDEATREQLLELDNLEFFPANWRADLKTGKENNDTDDFVNRVGRHVDAAMKELKKLNASQDFPENMLPKDKDFLHRYAPQDPDLALLKWDEIFRKDFDAWKQRDNEKFVMIRTFESAQRNAPDDVRKLVDKWRADNPLA